MSHAMSRIRPPLTAAIMCVVTIVAAPACADDDTGTGPDTIAGSADLPGGIPLFPDSRLIGTPTSAADTSTWSYVTERGDPMEVLDWYDERLDGWVVDEPIHPIGEGPQLSARGTWQRSASVLQISASLAPGVDDDRTVQYNLQLTDVP